MKFCFLALALTLGLIGKAPVQSDKPDSGRISLRLSVPKTQYRLGESIDVRGEISNKGTKPVFVSSDISTVGGGISHLNLTLSDTHGRLSPTMDMYEALTQSRPLGFPGAIFVSWVALQSGYSLSTGIPIGGETFSFLRKKGRYVLTGTYSSEGLDFPGVAKKFGLSKADVESLPYPSWSGKVQANSVWIEIVAPPKAPPTRK